MYTNRYNIQGLEGDKLPKFKTFDFINSSHHLTRVYIRGNEVKTLKSASFCNGETLDTIRNCLLQTTSLHYNMLYVLQIMLLLDQWKDG